VAAAAVEHRAPDAPAARTGAVIAALRERVPAMPVDRFLAADIATVRELVAEATLIRAAGLADGAADPAQEGEP
jgi:histidine ammonia-lyase